MPNLVITSTSSTINCDNGDYSGIAGPAGLIQKKVSFRKDAISRISLAPADAYVKIEFKGGIIEILLVFSATANALVVDSINTVAPTSNADLYDKLAVVLETP